jgi:hypothetical protein
MPAGSLRSLTIEQVSGKEIEELCSGSREEPRGRESIHYRAFEG